MIQTNGVKIKVSIDFLLSVIITVPPSSSLDSPTSLRGF